MCIPQRLRIVTLRGRVPVPEAPLPTRKPSPPSTSTPVRLPVIVVPCFNEAARLDSDAFLRLAESTPLRLLFVNDGSTDATAAVLEALRDRAPNSVNVLTLAQNSGKAEAVRQGLLEAIAGGAQVVGFVDADLSTPPAEVQRLLGILDARAGVQVLIGARVRLLGNAVERQAVRHYLGRIFATAASLALSLDIYDTQCGAKLFRVTPALTDALADPFGSRWIFDVELLGRLANGRRGIAPVPLDAFAEVPLLVWHDVAGSKVRPGHFLRAAGELAEVWLRLRARRQER